MALAKYSLAIPATSGRNVGLCLLAALGEKPTRFTRCSVVLAVYSYKVKRIPNVQPNISPDRIEWYVKNAVVSSINVTFLFLIFQAVPFDLCSGWFFRLSRWNKNTIGFVYVLLLGKPWLIIPLDRLRRSGTQLSTRMTIQIIISQNSNKNFQYFYCKEWALLWMADNEHKSMITQCKHVASFI